MNEGSGEGLFFGLLLSLALVTGLGGLALGIIRKKKSATIVGAFLVAIPAVFVAVVLLADATADRPSTTTVTAPASSTSAFPEVSLPPGTLEPAASGELHWPPGIAMVVLSTGYELYAVDRDGVRWSQEIESRSQVASAGPFAGPFDGVAVSNNRQFIAYVDHAAEIVVRSIRDGAITSRTPYRAEGETQLRCLSSDGYFAVLASAPPDLPKGTTSDRLPWRVTVLELRTGQATTQQPLEDLVKERTASDPKVQFTLYSLDFLPEHKLLVNYQGWERETYSYDPGTRAMEQIPGMSLVWSVSDNGMVYGGGMEPQGGKPLIWNGRATETLKLDVGSAYAVGGVFNSRGDALASLAMSPRGEPRGWQLFRQSQGTWQPDGLLAEHTWANTLTGETPSALSDDGTVAWTSVPTSTGEPVLLSHDFRTGAWKEWLGSESLPVHLDKYHFETIIPDE